jgi:recombination protein RecR
VAAPVARVIEAFRRLPGIGPKSAQRLAYHLVRMSEAEASELSEAVTGVKQRIKLCQICADITEELNCMICTDPNRDRSTICVVEEPLDVAAFERTRAYNGLYHVLHGAISPTSGIAASDLKIRELLERLHDERVSEIIVATNTNLDGEATAMYLQRAIAPAGIRVTRLARGLPSGTDIEYADDATLAHSLESRSEIVG